VADPVSITGLGVVSPFGDSLDAFRDALLSGATAIAADPAFVSAGCRSTLNARVSRFDPARWIAPMKLRRMDTTGPYALVAVRQAMERAGYAPTSDGDPRAGVVLGTYSAGGQATREYLEALFRGGPSGAPALLFNSTVGNAAAGLVGLEYKLCGPNATISQKEASGLAAIATAVDLLRLGRADAIAAGGMDAIYDIFYRAHDRFEVMNADREPGASAAPFSRCRGGFVMGEGGFALWLDHRPRPGVSVLAEILGAGSASADCALNAWPQSPEALARTMRLAMDDAGIDPQDVDVVYASANATAIDEVEARALKTVFAGSHAVVTSIKGALGESGAAGAAACVAAVACGAAGKIPPIANLREPDPATRSLHLAGTVADTPGEIALVNSVASGGALVSVVLRIPLATRPSRSNAK
jgi:3-oxoacyl-[acyl-carrier-protein] synthase II